MNKKELKTAECEVCGAKVPEGKRFCEVCAPVGLFDSPIQSSSLNQTKNLTLTETKDNTETKKDLKIENLGDANGISEYDDSPEKKVISETFDSDFEVSQEKKEQNL